ncbi:MAG: phytanoyl-CoA dioxygenase family protein [Phenylobacterium sp.]
MSVSGAGLSREKLRRFEERGLVKLDGLLPTRIAENMADRLWQELASKDGVQRSDRGTWRTEIAWGFQALRKNGAFAPMATSELRGVLDDLLGEGRWSEPPNWGQPLVRFPGVAKRWDVPHQVWHLDLTPEPKRPGLVGRLFALLAPLRPQGGATLVAAGSHRIAAAITERRGVHLSSQEMRRALAAEHAWFSELMSAAKPGEDRVQRFMGAANRVNGVELQVEEMTGEPGDVFLMHPNTLHAPSANMLDTPRLALAETIYPKGWFGRA